MVTHSSILAWSIPMDRGAWWAYSPWGWKELDTTEELSTVFCLSLLLWNLLFFVAEKYSIIYLYIWRVSQSCPTHCDPMDYTIHGILQARILDWVAFPCCRGSSQSKNQIQVSHTAGGPTAEPQGNPRIMEWVAYPFSSGSSWPRNQTGVSRTAGRFFTNWAIREALLK